MSNFSRAYTIYRADVGAMFMRPVAGVIMVVCIVALISPFVGPYKRSSARTKKGVINFKAQGILRLYLVS